MHKTQTAYAIAKVAYELMADRKADLLRPYADLLDTDIDQYTELEIQFDNQLNGMEIRASYRKAQDEMIAWAFDKVSKSRHFNARYAEAMAEIKANMHLGSVRNQMIDLSFRLA